MSNKEIHKFKLDNVNDLGISSFTRVDMPKGAKVINVSYAGGTIFLHAIVNKKNKEKQRWFAIFEEGMPMHDYENKTCEYIGMVNTVPSYHVFEVHD